MLSSSKFYHTILETKYRMGGYKMDKQPHTFEDTMLTMKDLQEIFGRGKRQAYELLHIPVFPAMKLGGKYLTSAKALDNWIQKNAGKRISK